MRKLYLFAIIGLLFTLGTANGEEKEKPKAEKTAVAELPDQLKRDGILISGKTYEQIFQAYIKFPFKKNKESVFITSDSLLNAYHVLYEESIGRVEEKQAVILEELVKALYARLPQRAKLYAIDSSDNYFRRAKLILGVAVKLFDPAFKIENPGLDKLAEIEVAEINKAEGIRMPEWLGKPSSAFAGIDYNRFKVRSFYNRSERLKHYFRAAQWLQAVPFQVNNDTDLSTFEVLFSWWRDLTKEYPDSRKYPKYFEIYYDFLGKQSGLGINSFNRYANIRDESGFDNFRKKLRDSKNKVFINDTIHYVPLAQDRIRDLRILPARQTPSALLFALTSDYPKSGQYFPNGLEVAAMLGSEFAMRQLSPEVRKIVEDNKFLLAAKPDNLYGLYMNALKTLFDKKNEKFPYFMKTEAWEIKSCNTALAGWAQIRHTWALQAKNNACVGCGFKACPGFVEPNVEFWGSMALLCEETKFYLKYYDCFGYDPRKDLNEYKKLLRLFEKDSLSSIRKKYPELKEAADVVYWIFAFTLIGTEDPVKRKKDEIAKLKEFIRILETNTLDRHPEIKKILFDSNSYDLKALWNKLQITSLKLQAISLKQINNFPLNDADKKFIEYYGAILAEIMLYKGNSYFSPVDDAMRVTDVVTSFDKNYIRYLEVGIGRPREILVLYPTPEGNVLCKGAILPYYEFFSKDRLTDAEWKKILDSKAERPAIPKWLTPIVQTGKLEVPVWEKRY
jgi:hypothetical protein